MFSLSNRIVGGKTEGQGSFPHEPPCVEILHTSGYDFWLQYTPEPVHLQPKLPSFHLKSKTSQVWCSRVCPEITWFSLSHKNIRENTRCSWSIFTGDKSGLSCISVCREDSIYPQISEKYHGFSALGFSVAWEKKNPKHSNAALEALCSYYCCAQYCLSGLCLWKGKLTHRRGFTSIVAKW